MNIDLGPLPADAVQLIVEGLGELPHRKVAALIEHIVRVANAQLTPPAPPKRSRKKPAQE